MEWDGETFSTSWKEEDKKLIIDNVVSGKSAMALPIVFVCKKPEGGFPVDLSSLAFKLRGVAHVIYEGDSIELGLYASELDCEGKDRVAIIITWAT